MIFVKNSNSTPYNNKLLNRKHLKQVMDLTIGKKVTEFVYLFN